MLNYGTTYIVDKVLPKTKNKFWIDVFKSHIKVSAKQEPTKIEHFQTSPLFHNDNIKIGNRAVYNKSCIKNGIIYIDDIIKDDGNMFSYEELLKEGI